MNIGQHLVSQTLDEFLLMADYVSEGCGGSFRCLIQVQRRVDSGNVLQPARLAADTTQCICAFLKKASRFTRAWASEDLGFEILRVCRSNGVTSCVCLDDSGSC